MKKNVIIGLISIIVAFSAIIGLAKACAPKSTNSQEAASTVSSSNKKSVSTQKKTTEKIIAFRPYQDPQDLRKEGTWNKKSEKKKYPTIKPTEKDLTLRVSLEGNRTYLLKSGKVIYTMLSSGGIFKKGKSVTPTGTFKIEGDRGNSFFNSELNEGANNWTSWSSNNVYLFHSVPTKADGSYNLKEATKLGKIQGSHGCIRLSVPDSKWIMENIPAGTKVVIKNH